MSVLKLNHRTKQSRTCFITQITFKVRNSTSIYKYNLDSTKECVVVNSRRDIVTLPVIATATRTYYKLPQNTCKYLKLDMSHVLTFFCNCQ